MEGLLSNLGDIIQTQGWLAFPFCFLGGIISSASPCVLAMIPLIIGFVGGYAEGSQKKAIQYSLMFTLGLTITFTILGHNRRRFGQALRRCWHILVLYPAAGRHPVGIVSAFLQQVELKYRFIPTVHAKEKGAARSFSDRSFLRHHSFSLRHSGAGSSSDLCRYQAGYCL